MIGARGDYEVLSSGRTIGPLACVLMLFMVFMALAPFAKPPPPADRLSDLDLFLGAPVAGHIALRTDGPAQGSPPPGSGLD